MIAAPRKIQALFDVRREVGRKLESFRERQRMLRIRRDPAALTALLRSATTILIVCHGNIIRSPFAARLLAQMLAARASIAVLSAGMEASPGKRPHPDAAAAASRLGVHLHDHASVAISRAIVESADVIFVMDLAQLVEIRRRFPQTGDRAFLMAALCRGIPLEIEDPFGRDAAAFHDCYARISRSARAIADVVNGGVRL